MSNRITEELKEVKSILENVSYATPTTSTVTGTTPSIGGAGRDEDFGEEDKVDQDAFLEEYGEFRMDAYLAVMMMEHGLINIEWLEREMTEEEEKYLDMMLSEDVEASEMTEATEKQMKAFELITLDSLRANKEKTGILFAPPPYMNKLADDWGPNILKFWWEAVGMLMKSGEAYGDASVADIIRDPSLMKSAYNKATRIWKKKMAARYGIDIAPTKERKMSVNDKLKQFASWAAKMLRNGKTLKKYNPDVWAQIQNILQDKAKAGKAKKAKGYETPPPPVSQDAKRSPSTKASKTSKKSKK